MYNFKVCRVFLLLYTAHGVLNTARSFAENHYTMHTDTVSILNT